MPWFAHFEILHSHPPSALVQDDGGRVYTSPDLTAEPSNFEQRLGYPFVQRELLRRALTHKSYSHEAKDLDVRHNETFEFLGDSVLGFVIGDMLFRHFPSSTRARSRR